jgi:hypothetical protein
MTTELHNEPIQHQKSSQHYKNRYVCRQYCKLRLALPTKQDKFRWLLIYGEFFGKPAQLWDAEQCKSTV